MIANLGWIAMTLVAGGQVHLQWSKQMVTAHAGRRLSRFIEEHARQIRSIAALVDGVCHEGIRRDTLSPLLGTAVARLRSEERRVGKECVSKCRSRGAPNHTKK